MIHLRGEHRWRCTEATRGDSHARHGRFLRWAQSSTSSNHLSAAFCDPCNCSSSYRHLWNHTIFCVNSISTQDKMKNCSRMKILTGEHLFPHLVIEECVRPWEVYCKARVQFQLTKGFHFSFVKPKAEKRNCSCEWKKRTKVCLVFLFFDSMRFKKNVISFQLLLQQQFTISKFNEHWLCFIHVKKFFPFPFLVQLSFNRGNYIINRQPTIHFFHATR